MNQDTNDIERDSMGPYRISWRSKGHYDTILSVRMCQILRLAIRNQNITQGFQPTLKALMKKGLCSKTGQLTSEGKVAALSLLPLHEQCAFLEIPMERLALENWVTPEQAALDHYKQKRVNGCFSEGGIIQIIFLALCFDVLKAICEEKKGKYDSISLSGPLQFMGFKHYFIEFESQLIEIIKNSNPKTLSNNFDLILDSQFNQSWDFWGYKGITKNIVVDIYKGMGNEVLSEIAKRFFVDPYAYCKGWPDLAIIDDGVVKFIEVKTSDKLHGSQIITMGDMSKIAGVNISVLKIVSSEIKKLQKKKSNK